MTNEKNNTEDEHCYNCSKRSICPAYNNKEFHTRCVYWYPINPENNNDNTTNN